MPINVFISYSHKDETYREELGEHLSNLRQQGIIVDWHDRKITPGADWASEIDTNLNNAQIILLLISPAFMNSDYCYGIEMKRALERHDAKESWVIPIILRPVDWENAPFARLQVRPTYAKPVSKWDDRDDAYVDIVQGIRMAINELKPASKKEPDETPVLEQPSIFHVPFRRNSYFTGRDDILDRLHHRLTSSETPQPQVINGLPGIGKTQTAVEYAYRHHDDYQYVLWVKADSSENLESDVASLATVLNLPTKDEKDQNLIVAAVKNWLQTHTGWLLILDNVEDLDMVRGFLPLGSRGHMLLTTNVPVTEMEFQEVALKDMEPEESELFLLRRTRVIELDASPDTASETDRSKAREISEIMGGLPLALSQAGAYIDRTKCGLGGFQDRYHKQKVKLLEDPRGLVSDHPEPVATTWSLSFDKVEQTNPAAADLLRLCAFLHPDAIPEELILDGASELTPTLESIGNDPSVLDDAILELLRYSLVRRNPNATLTIHRLLQAVLKDEMDEQTQRQWAERVVRAVNSAFPDVEFNKWSHCQRYLPQVQVCKELITEWGLEFEEAARLLDQAGDYLRERGQYTEAEPLITHALAIREKVLEPEHPSVAQSLNNLARIYHHQGKYNQAESLYQQALAIRENALGSEHPDVADSLNDLAVLFDAQGKYAEAELLYQQARAIREKVLGPEHPDVALSLNNLAGFYWTQGKYAEAEPLYQRARAIREKVLGPEHPAVATSLGNLASLYQAQGKYAEAELLYQRARAIREKVLGPEHPDVANSLGSLASLYQAQGKYAEAEPLYQRVQAIYEKVLGPEHPAVAISLGSLASLYQAQGKYAEAEPLYQRVQAIYEKVLGPEHPDVATSLGNLASLYQAQGKYAEAELLYQRARATREKMLGPEHPDVANSLNNLASLYQAQGKYAEAEVLYRRALAIHEKVLGPEHPNVANSLNNLALLYKVQGQLTLALPNYQRALTIWKQALGNDHPDVATCLMNLGGIYYSQGKYVWAEQLYQQAMAIKKKTLGSNHPDLAKTFYNLAVLYGQQGKYDRAKPLFRQALSIYEKALGPDHPDLATCLESYAAILRRARQTREALPLEERAMAIRIKHAQENPI